MYAECPKSSLQNYIAPIFLFLIQISFKGRSKPQLSNFALRLISVTQLSSVPDVFFLDSQEFCFLALVIFGKFKFPSLL